MLTYPASGHLCTKAVRYSLTIFFKLTVRNLTKLGLEVWQYLKKSCQDIGIINICPIAKVFKVQIAKYWKPACLTEPGALRGFEIWCPVFQGKQQYILGNNHGYLRKNV